MTPQLKKVLREGRMNVAEHLKKVEDCAECRRADMNKMLEWYKVGMPFQLEDEMAMTHSACPCVCIATDDDDSWQLDPLFTDNEYYIRHLWVNKNYKGHMSEEVKHYSKRVKADGFQYAVCKWIAEMKLHHPDFEGDLGFLNITFNNLEDPGVALLRKPAPASFYMRHMKMLKLQWEMNVAALHFLPREYSLKLAEWKEYVVGDYLEWCCDNLEEQMYLVICKAVKNLMENAAQDLEDCGCIAGVAPFYRIFVKKIPGKTLSAYDFEENDGVISEVGCFAPWSTANEQKWQEEEAPRVVNFT